MRRIFLALTVLLVLAAASAAAAPICQPELRDGLTDLSIDRPATGIDAALVLERAVKLVEPALPPLVQVDKLPVAPGTPHADDVRYLAERRLLPGGWTPASIDAKTWNAMLSRFEGWYKVQHQEVAAPKTVGDLIRDAGTALAQVSRAVRPAALLASDPQNPDRIAFWAIIWNWTVYPRLIVLRPRQDVSLANGPRAVLGRMGDCAVRIDSYVMAKAQDAAQLFLATNKSRMYVVSSIPSGGTNWPERVSAGSEIDAFAFRAPLVKGLDVYAAVFDGPKVGFTKVLELLPKLRTDMSPVRFLRYMRTP